MSTTKVVVRLDYAFIRANFNQNLVLEHLPNIKADITELATLVDKGAITPEEMRVAAGWKTDKKNTMNSNQIV